MNELVSSRWRPRLTLPADVPVVATATLLTERNEIHTARAHAEPPVATILRYSNDHPLSSPRTYFPQ